MNALPSFSALVIILLPSTESLPFFFKWCDQTFCCCMNAEPGGEICQDCNGPECAVRHKLFWLGFFSHPPTKLGLSMCNS